MQAILSARTAILLFLLVRAAVTGALFLLTSGEEVASDARFHHMVFDQPLAILMGLADLTVSSYPPLQGVVEWPMFTFLTLFMPAFLAFRVMFTAIELVSFIVLLAIIQRLKVSALTGLTITVLFIISPHQLLASNVFIQDEVLCQLFVMLAVWFVVDNNKSGALFMLALGVLIGKIFLILPLFYLTFFYRPRWADALPWLLTAGVYALNVVWAISNDGNIPFVGFSPDPAYGSHHWTLLVGEFPESVADIKVISLLVSVVTQGLLCLWFFSQSRALRDALDPWLLIALPLTLFFFTFYQQNPEYLLTLWPVLLLACRQVWVMLCFSAIVSMAWLPNLMFGLMNIGIINSSKSPTRNRVLQPFVDWIGIDFATLHPASIVAYSLVYTVMLAGILYLAWRSRISHPQASLRLFGFNRQDQSTAG